MARLLEIAKTLGIPDDDQDDFVANFEDSEAELRDQVFDLVRSQGHDGAIIVNDMTPEVAGGDWCFRTSYVAFEPRRQVRFAFEAQALKAIEKPVSGASFSM